MGCCGSCRVCSKSCKGLDPESSCVAGLVDQHLHWFVLQIVCFFAPLEMTKRTEQSTFVPCAGPHPAGTVALGPLGRGCGTPALAAAPAAVAPVSALKKDRSKDGSRTVCSVCLENYVAGDKARLLCCACQLLLHRILGHACV